MCRLLAIKSKNKEILKDSLLSFRSLDENGKLPTGIDGGHKDGFGIVFYNQGKIIGEFKDYNSSSKSERFESALEFLRDNDTDLCIAHIRKATIGGLNINNIHPFTDNNISFAHNGTVASIKNDIDEKVKSKAKGETDSELLFKSLLAQNNYVVNKDSIQSFVNDIRSKYFEGADGDKNTSFLNIVTDGSNVYATRSYNERHSKNDEMNFDSYYTLYCGTNDEAFIFASEVLPSIGKINWTLLKNGETAVA